MVLEIYHRLMSPKLHELYWLSAHGEDYCQQKTAVEDVEYLQH